MFYSSHTSINIKIPATTGEAKATLAAGIFILMISLHPT